MDDEIYDRIIFLADPDLNEPVLVIGLEGWIDAGIGRRAPPSATLLETIPTEVLATFDTEYFIDQRARRPLARIVDGVTTELTWPEIQLRYGRDGDGADVLFLVGPEPDFHWSDFVDVVTDAAGRFDVRLVVGLGAFPGPDAPHPAGARHRHRARARARSCSPPSARSRASSRCPPASAPPSSSASPRSTWTSSRCGRGCPTTSPRCPTPQASAALIDGLARIAGLTLDAGHLRASADEARQRVDDLVTNNPEHAAMVQRSRPRPTRPRARRSARSCRAATSSRPSSSGSCAARRARARVARLVDVARLRCAGPSPSA